MISILTQADINKLKDFLETDTMSATFTSNGLQYFALKGDKGKLTFTLDANPELLQQNTYICLLIKETLRFLDTGEHEMPLDLSTLTAFQQRVFDTVCRIKPGTICTYQDIAQMLDKPNGARAVGTAITKNPVSYFIPTHRLLPKIGIGICKSGAGYLREKLLEHEGHDVNLLRGNYVCKRESCCME